MEPIPHLKSPYWKSTQKIANYAITGQDIQSGFHNLNATTNITLTLPKAVIGGAVLQYKFLVSTAHTITVTPKVATDTIRGFPAGTSITLAGVGSELCLECWVPGFWEIATETTSAGGQFFNPTPIEIAVNSIPVNFNLRPGLVDRYGTNTGGADMSAALQAAVNQMVAGGAPVRLIPYTGYLILTPPTFGTTSTALQKINIGCEGGWAQLHNRASANQPTLNLTGRAFATIFGIFGTGDSSNPNDFVRLGTIGTGGSTQLTVRDCIAQMAGHAIYGADCNTILLDNVTSWPDNPPILPIAQTVTASAVLDHAYFEGGFAHDITMYRCRLQPNITYSSTGGGVNRGIKIVPSQSYNFRIRDCLLQGENGSNTLIGLQLGGASSSIEGAIIEGNYHENSFFQFNNVNRSSIKGNTNGASGGGMVCQLNTQNNDIDANSELAGGILSFDSSSGGNRYDPTNFTTITDNATVPNIRASQLGVSAAGGALINPMAYGASMTPNVTLGKRIRILVTDANAWTLNAPTNLVRGDIIYVTVQNTTGGATGVGTFAAIYKLASQTPAMPGTLKQRCWILHYDGTNLTVDGCEPTTDTGF